MSTGRTAQVGRVTDDVAAALVSLDLVVEDVLVTPAGKRRLVKVLIDRDTSALLAGDDTTSPVDPLSLDEVADATRAVSDALDASDVMGTQPYVLEVSSPGTDRPLTQARHFRRNVGRLITLTRAEGEALTGRITGANDHEVTIEVPGPKGRAGTAHSVTYEDGTRAQVQVEFNRPADADDTEDDEKDS